MNPTWKNACKNVWTARSFILYNQLFDTTYLIFELMVENTDIYIYVKAFEHTVAISTQKIFVLWFFCSQLSSLMGLWVYHSWYPRTCNSKHRLTINYTLAAGHTTFPDHHAYFLKVVIFPLLLGVTICRYLLC